MDFVVVNIPVTGIEIVYLTFERIWNLARESFAPVWSLSKLFFIKKFSYKITAKDPIPK